jgi:hypothetical protein
MLKNLMAAGAAVVLAVGAANANPTVGVAVVAPITPVTVGIGVGVAVLGHEAFARKPFGNNGEGMKAVRAVGKAFKKKIKW